MNERKIGLNSSFVSFLFRPLIYANKSLLYYIKKETKEWGSCVIETTAGGRARVTNCTKETLKTFCRLRGLDGIDG